MNPKIQVHTHHLYAAITQLRMVIRDCPENHSAKMVLESLRDGVCSSRDRKTLKLLDDTFTPVNGIKPN